jgi:hypothetical protein
MIKNIAYYENFELFLEENAQREEPVIFFVAESTPFTVQTLKGCVFEFFGAIFPQIIYADKHYDKGLIAITFDTKTTQAGILRNMSDFALNSMQSDACALFVIVDGLSAHIDTFLEELFIHTNDSVKIMGGGAGKLTLKQEPVIFDMHGIYQNAALLISSTKEITLGVNHGWEKMDGPFVATACEGTKLKQINYQNAFSFYDSKLSSQNNAPLSPENFFAISKAYPIGIETYAKETVVRDPITFDAEGLVLVGRIEENAVIYLLKGEKEGLIKAASNASLQAVNLAKKDVENLFVIDCISRVLFLEDAFEEELQAIGLHAQNATVFGALTLGEIANNSSRYIEFFNKTCVIGAI